MEKYLITGLILVAMTFLIVGIAIGVGIGLYLIMWGVRWKKIYS